MSHERIAEFQNTSSARLYDLYIGAVHGFDVYYTEAYLQAELEYRGVSLDGPKPIDPMFEFCTDWFICHIDDTTRSDLEAMNFNITEGCEFNGGIAYLYDDGQIYTCPASAFAKMSLSSTEVVILDQQIHLL